MDLRKYGISEGQQETACRLLNYQPFIISDDVQTGVAYSWIHQEEGGRNARANDFVVARADTRLLPQEKHVTEDVWTMFSDANQRLRTMYDDWLRAIADAYPGGTLLDPACNNGYFLIRALEYGMSQATGYDRANYSESVDFLNAVTGQDAKFIHKAYSPLTHTIENCEQHDVAVASLILCHISDPLYFLAFLGRMAKEAIFLFTGMGTEPGYRIYYSKPNRFYSQDEFPVCFDNDVGLSRDLLYDGLSMLGFRNVKVFERRDTWLPASWYNQGNQQAILASR